MNNKVYMTVGKIIYIVLVMFGVALAFDGKACVAADDLRDRVVSAEAKSREQPVLGCVAPIGSSLEVGATFMLDAIYDHNNKIIKETETHIASGDTILYDTEAWYDVATGDYYSLDKLKTRYLYSPQGDLESKYDYLSLDFYLDYVGKGDIKLIDTTTVKTVDGREVNCDIIRVSKEVADSMPYIGKINDTSSDADSAKRTVIMDYFIGVEDGLIYTIIHQNEEDKREISFYYPKEGLAIPDEFKENASLMAYYIIKDKGIQYFSYYKNGETHLSVYYYDKKFKSLKLPSSVKVNSKSYKVDSISERAFKNMDTLKKITIPESISAIGKDSFTGCTKLKTVTVKNKTLKKKLKKSKKYRKKSGFNNKVKIK